MKNLAQALASIYFRVPRGIQFGLDDVRAACERADSPHLRLPVVHIAGTNGKGSVASMVSSVLRQAGQRVGLFTSPHLCRFSERIQIDGTPIDDAMLTEVLQRAVETGPTLSFFETTFLAAMLAFRTAAVDIAVLEVGLGGRLDATNVVPSPLVTAVTRIALDHTDKLGRTKEAIAAEKAAIAKPGVPMVLGPLDEAVDRVCRDTAAARGAMEILGLGRECPTTRVGEHGVQVTLASGTMLLRPSLQGEHQLDNAAVAALICSVVGRSIRGVSDQAITTGIGKAVWPGRLELVRDWTGDVVLDSAHNPDGALALARYLASSRRASGRGPEATALVFGAVSDKSWQEMLQILAPCAASRFFVEPGGRAAASLSEMARLFGGACVGDVAEALKKARSAVGADGVVVVAGSIFLAGSARAILLGLERDPPVAL